jgi:hypothetical protein
MSLRQNRISHASRVLAFIMAIYLLNFSVDSRDAHPDSVAEDLSVNDIESFYEFLAEGMLGVKNAVEEHDERDQDDAGSFEFKKFFFTPFVSRVQFIASSHISISQSPIDYCEPLEIRAIEISSPPPRS